MAKKYRFLHHISTTLTTFHFINPIWTSIGRITDRSTMIFHEDMAADHFYMNIPMVNSQRLADSSSLGSRTYPHSSRSGPMGEYQRMPTPAV